MNPVTFSLCAKPVIGVVMYISTLCAFPALFDNRPIDLGKAGTSVTVAFEAPVDLGYALSLNFVFPAGSRAGLDIVGERGDAVCDGRAYATIAPEKRPGLGRPIPVHVLVRHAGDNRVVFDRTLESLCVTSWSGPANRSRTVAGIPLTRGKYTATITNLVAQPGLDGARTALSLHVGGGK